MRPNNFDLLRLIAAISVAFVHTAYRLEIDVHYVIAKFFHFIPGVPIFFFISGFLISLSFKRNSNIFQYSKNRVLRIYPALYICLIISILSVLYVGYLTIDIFHDGGFWIWIAAQMSIIQFYNPEFLRGYGVGSLNGSLWTISVELQFYILVPILYKILTSENKNKMLIIMIIIFSICNVVFQSFNDVTFREQTLVYKFLHVSFVPWFYMFLIGVFFQENFNKFEVLYKMNSFKKTLYILVILYIYNIVGMNPITFFLFVTIIFIFVFSLQNMSQNILNGNDYSYGIYIYHALIINYFLYNNYLFDMQYLFLVIIISALLAFLSWHIIEKPILGYKNKGKK